MSEYLAVLDEMLSDAIRQSGWFVAFLTPGYGSTRWTADEYEEALALFATLPCGPNILPVLLGGALREGMKEHEAISAGEDAGSVAAAIRERISSRS